MDKLRGTEKVLLVEDEDPLRAVVTDLLTHLGYSVLSAANGPEALKLVADHPVIDMLVTDVVMPGMSGPELAKRILQSRPNLKIIFVSGYTAGKLAAYGSFTPEAVLVQKPFSIRVLTMKMREMLDA
jgi:two-component system cell cycle sensor histidine kinase/response regulator CckA